MAASGPPTSTTGGKVKDPVATVAGFPLLPNPPPPWWATWMAIAPRWPAGP